jgi:hypothetical protein
MNSTQPAAIANSVARPLDVPEELIGELDAEQLRKRPEPLIAMPVEQVPEDVIAERDREARLDQEEIRQRLAEGRPPAEDEPRS